MPPVLSEEETALDPYLLLNIGTSASEKEVKKAFRTMSLKYHPDKVGPLWQLLNRFLRLVTLMFLSTSESDPGSW